MRRYSLALLAALTTAVPARAAEPVEVRYEVFWGGFRAAEARLVNDGGALDLSAQATGLVDSLSAFALEAEAAPGLFQTRSRTKNMESRLAVDFTGQPRTVVDEIRRTDPDTKEEPRPPVPEAMKAGTTDPLHALMSASQRALAARPGERFTMPVFDGRNRYDATVTVTGPGSMDVSGRRVAGIRASVEIKPLAGFRPKTRERWDGARFIVLVDPATALPARIVSDSFAIATVISAVPPVKKVGG
ncbi:MAG: DUF3108 domain-containing protein [Magnetospirillum sp.]|nr:DUF3108 domain-containing protein [Magnetospirillum sp.]